MRIKHPRCPDCGSRSGRVMTNDQINREFGKPGEPPRPAKRLAKIWRCPCGTFHKGLSATRRGAQGEATR